MLAQTMQLRYYWPDGTLDQIDWDVHRQAVAQQHGRKIHYVKLCHEMLPIGKLVSLYKEHFPDFCPLCKTPKENHHHVLRCLHPTRVKWRDTLLKNLTLKCRSLRTDPQLTSILIAGLSAWLSQTQMEVLFPPQYRLLLKEQHQIGWSHFFQGRISLRWAQLQQEHLYGLPPIKGHDGSHWSRSIIAEIFKNWNELWDFRNADRHGKDKSTRSLALQTQAHLELTIAYTKRDSVLHRDKHIYYDDIATHQALPTQDKAPYPEEYQRR